MFRLHNSIIILSCLMVLVGCLQPLKVQVNTVKMTRQVKPGLGSETKEFSVNDSFAHAIVELQNVSGEHELHWVWLDPQGQSYIQSAPLKVGHETKRQNIQASHAMSIKSERAAELPGEWTLQVFLDNRQVATKKFRINARAAKVPPPPVIQPFRTQQRRTALIIGNNNYQVLPTLNNPINDAQDIAGVLSKLNFEVTELHNATLRQMKEASRAFGRALEFGGVGLFYFAGHGIQVRGENYLIPIDAKIERAYEAEYTSLPSRWVLDAMSEAKSLTNIIILDACRNNPISSIGRSTRQGLAGVQAGPRVAHRLLNLPKRGGSGWYWAQ